MTSRPSSATLLLCLLLTACEVPPPESAEVADAPAEAVTDTAADTVPEREPLPPNSAIIRLDASDPNLAVWQDRDISGDPPREPEPGPIEVGSVLTFYRDPQPPAADSAPFAATRDRWSAS